MGGRIVYAYPISRTVSFTLVARSYIRILRRAYRVSETDVDSVDGLRPVARPALFVHPFFLPLLSRPGAAERFRTKVRPEVSTVVAIDVADSDRISERAVEILGAADYVIVNSEWSRRAYEASGVRKPVFVVPHALGSAFIGGSRPPRNPVVRELARYRREKPHIRFLLFFLWHSGYRKGADLVYEIVKRLVERLRKVVLVVKIRNILDPYLGRLLELPTVVLKGWLPEDDLAALYDAVDAVLVPSRGGSFELCAVEALARGRPIIAARGSVVEEHLPERAKNLMLARVRRWVTVLPGNDVHVGRGPELDPDDAAERLEYMLVNRESVEDVVAEAREYVIGKYSEERVAGALLGCARRILGG